MPRPLKAYLHVERSRHGRAVYYFQRPHAKRIRLPDNYGDPSFWQAYELALSGIATPREIITPATFDMGRKQDVGKALSRAIVSARARAAARGTAFDIDVQWATSECERQRFKCALSGIPFFMKAGDDLRIHPYAPSFDQIEPGAGYTRGNVRVVIFAINVMLWDRGPAVFERVANAYLKNKKQTSIFAPRSQIFAPQKIDSIISGLQS